MVEFGFRLKGGKVDVALLDVAWNTELFWLLTVSSFGETHSLQELHFGRSEWLCWKSVEPNVSRDVFGCVVLGSRATS